LGEMAERFELEQELGRGSSAGGGRPKDPAEAAESGIEAARQEDPARALVLFDAARRLLRPIGHPEKISPQPSLPIKHRAVNPQGDASNGNSAEPAVTCADAEGAAFRQPGCVPADHEDDVRPTPIFANSDAEPPLVASGLPPHADRLAEARSR